MKSLICAAALTLAVSSPAFADMAMVKDGHLVNSAGMTLYTFDNDKDGVSACYDACATNWPPLIADAGAKAEGEYKLVARKDGAMQWAYDGKPLYLWIKDTKPGDMTGDNFKNVWHIVKQ